MNLTLRFGPAMVALSLITSVRAESVADRFRENEQKQEQLAGEARQLMAGLDVMLGEYERNGLAGEDVAVVQKLKARGFVSPYLKTFVVARCNPLRFMKEPPGLEELIRTIRGKVERFNVEKIRQEDIVASGGGVQDEE